MNIKGQVDLNGVANILVGDRADATVRTALLTSNELTGLGNAAPIFYSSDATALTIEGGKAADTYNIQSTSGNAVTTIQGGAASDTFEVGGVAFTGVLDNIQGPLTIVGGSGTNSLVLNDQGSTVGHMYVLSASTLARDGNMPIAFSGIKSLTLDGDSAGNTLVVSALSLGQHPGRSRQRH